MIILYYVDYKEVGRRIAERRRELGLKQWQVNEIAKLSDKYLSNIERATTVPSIDVLMKLCEALDITPDVLLLGTTQKSDNVYAALSSRVNCMSPKQAELALSLMDWILTQKI